MSICAASSGLSNCLLYCMKDEKKDYDEPIAIAPIHSKLKKKVTYFTINFFPF